MANLNEEKSNPYPTLTRLQLIITTNMKTTLKLLVLSFLGFSANAQSIEQGLKYIDNEKYSSAKAEFNKLIAKDPKDGNAYYYLGDIYLKHQQKDSAKIYFEKGLAVAPKNPLSMVGLGTLDYINNQQEAAKLKFDQAISNGKRNAIMYYKIGECYAIHEKKNYSDAIFYLKEKALVYDNSLIDAHLLLGDIYLWQNDGNNAAANYNNALLVNPKSAKTMIRKGQIYLYSKNYTEALNLYLKGIQSDSSYSPAYRELGELYAKAQRFNEALAAYKTYIDRSDNNDETKLMYGKFLYLAKDYLKAIDILKELQEKSTDLVIERILGYCYFETGDYNQSLKYLNQFVSNQEPTKLQSIDFEYLGKTFTKLNDPKLKTDSLAVLSYGKAVSMDTSKFYLNNDIATLLISAKKFKEASEVYKIIVAKKPNSINDFINLGRTYYFANLNAEADTTFSQFITKWPTSVNGYIWKARAKRKIDTGDKLWLAKPYFEKYIEVATDEVKYKKDLVEAYTYLGAYYYNQKDKPKSTEIWTKVKALDPGNKIAEEALKAK